MLRLFVGLSLPVLLRQRLIVMQGGIEGARWTERENFHITLAFLGEIDETTAEDADEALSALRAPAFDLSLKGTGTFQRGEEPTTLWIGVTPAEALQRLKEKIDRALEKARVPLERRKYTPHVTLAYLRGVEEQKVARFMQQHNLFSTESFPVEEFILYQSHQTKSGSSYEELRHYPLTPARSTPTRPTPD